MFVGAGFLWEVPALSFPCLPPPPPTPQPSQLQVQQTQAVSLSANPHVIGAQWVCLGDPVTSEDSCIQCHGYPMMQEPTDKGTTPSVMTFAVIVIERITNKIMFIYITTQGSNNAHSLETRKLQYQSSLLTLSPVTTGIQWHTLSRPEMRKLIPKPVQIMLF